MNAHPLLIKVLGTILVSLPTRLKEIEIATRVKESQKTVLLLSTKGNSDKCWRFDETRYCQSSQSTATVCCYMMCEMYMG